MKVLIVDDEAHVRETVRMLIPWERHGVTSVLEACSGEQAAAVIEAEKPQIVFTDMMMPGMDGIEVLKWIREHAGRTKVIVISGYDDFQLVRSAMKYGGVDYILKPIDEFELNETFLKAVASWQEEDGERLEMSKAAMAANQLRPVLADKALSRLIADPEYYGEALRALGERLGAGGTDGGTTADDRCRVAVIAFDTLDYRLRKKFESAMDLLIFAVCNIAEELMSKHGAGVAFRNWNEQGEVVLLFIRGAEEAPRIAEEIQRSLHAALRGDFHIGVGPICPFPAGVARAYLDAQSMLRQRNLLAKSNHLHCYAEYKPVALLCPLSHYEDRLYLAMQSGESEAIRRVLDEWAESVDKLPAVSHRLLEWWWQEFNLMLSKWLSGLEEASGGGSLLTRSDVSFRLPMNEWEEFDMRIWLSAMEMALQEISDLLRGQGNGHVIHEVESYIRVHYAEDIQLQGLADMFHVSPSHLSRTFKHQLGETISDYVTKLRIGKAKLLLANPGMKLAYVAKEVGYQDEKYFSKAFKRCEGVSPKEFRGTLKR